MMHRFNHLVGFEKVQKNHVAQMDGISESESDDDWEEMNDEAQVVECLFCNVISKDLTDALKHLESTHNFSFAVFKNKHALDVYSYIKLINFIRKKDVQPEELNDFSAKSWESDEYLTPVIQDDPWLMLGI